MLGYEFAIQENTAYRVDINKLVENLTHSDDSLENVVDELAKKMMEKDFEIGLVLRNKDIPHDNVAMYKISTEIARATKTYYVHFFIKDSVNRVYIPGSTIKGAMKTYYEGANLKKESKDVAQLEQKIAEILGEKDGRKRTEKISSFLKRWDQLFKSGERRIDMLIRDAMPTNQTQEILTLSTLEIHAEREGEIYCQQEKIYGEIVKPGTTFRVYFGRVDIKTLEGILKDVDEYCRELVKTEENFYREYGGGLYKNIAEFYEGLKTRKNDEYVFRIGMGSSFLFTSILPVLKILGSENAEKFFKEVLPRRRSSKLTVPDSRKLTKVGRNLYPLGWVSLKIERCE